MAFAAAYMYKRPFWSPASHPAYTELLSPSHKILAYYSCCPTTNIRSCLLYRISPLHKYTCPHPYQVRAIDASSQIIFDSHFLMTLWISICHSGICVCSFSQYASAGRFSFIFVYHKYVLTILRLPVPTPLSIVVFRCYLSFYICPPLPVYLRSASFWLR